MTFRTLIRRSLGFYWRSHLGVVIGAAIGSAALVGALVVGDSVKGSLREQALERLGDIDSALLPTHRLVGETLAERLFRLAPLDSGSDYAPLLILPATAVSLESGNRANSIQLIGVNGRFAGFGGELWSRRIEPGTAWLNEALAVQLGIREGQTVIVRANKPSALSEDAPIAPGSTASLSLRLRVASIAPPESLGDLDLVGSGESAFNLFVRLEDLQQAGEVAARVNCILARSASVESRVAVPEPVADLMSEMGIGEPLHTAAHPDSQPVQTQSARLRKAWRFADTQCSVTTVAEALVELSSERVFLDPPVERAAREADTNARPLLTYIANLIRSGTNATPYSMVTAAGPPWTPDDLADDEILLNQWLAEDLQAHRGDAVTLAYYDPESGARLTERTNTFRVHSIVPMNMPWADRTLMPDFPGIEKAESTAEWDTAFPLTYKIRPQDDDYWEQYRGTPKAFITLAAGQRMWANRFGKVTAIRFPVQIDGQSALTPTPSAGERGNRQSAQPAAETGRSQSASTQSEKATQVSSLPAGEDRGKGERTDAFRAALERRILSGLDPAELGLRFEPVRAQALQAAEGAQDFGGLFIGFSLFLIAAALILMALLFQFGLEQRAAEVGTLAGAGLHAQAGAAAASGRRRGVGVHRRVLACSAACSTPRPCCSG